MDDPWGSPWAEPPAKSTTAAPEPPTSLLSPPPRAFFGATSPGASPWADDSGGFGGWAEPNTSKHDDSPASGEWGAWGEASPTRLTPATRLDHPGKASPLAWPSSAVPSPRLSPMPRSRASSTRRPSAADPWAAELSHNLSKFDGPLLSTSEREQAPQAPRDYHTPPESKSASQDGTRLDIDHGALAIDEIPAAISQTVQAPRSPTLTSPTEIGDDIKTEHSTKKPLAAKTENFTGPDPSSSAGKVQELVGMFDGLAKTANVQAEQNELGQDEHDHCDESSTDGEEVAGGNTNPDHTADSDSESNMDSDSGPSRNGSEHGHSVTKTKPGRPDAVLDEQLDGNITSGLESEPQSYQGHSPAIDEIITKYGPITFTPDVDALEQLFANIALPSVPMAAGPEPQDAIIKDSFGQISERKTWYRLSRFGSKRRYDQGDDDGYTRVAWHSTKLHDDTIVIVRRWMEEDSFVGKSMLGGNKRASVFNWDSQAAPVDLSTIYARKTSSDSARLPTAATALHAAQSSVSSQTSAWDAKGQSREPSQSDQSSSTTAPVAQPSFGWSSSGPKATVSFALPPSALPASSTVSNKTLVSEVAKRVPPTESLVLQMPEQSASTQHEEEEDDDDWGDMVGSPGLEDNTPSLLNSAFAPVSAPSALAQPKQDLSSSAAIPNSTAWDKDDFSFFEDQAGAGRKSSTELGHGSNSMPTVSAVQPSLEKVPMTQVLAADLPSRTNSLPLPQRQDMAIAKNSSQQFPSQPSANVVEDERIAKSIVDALPDISYMLR